MKHLPLLFLVLLLYGNLQAQTSQKKQFPVGEKCKSVMKEIADLHGQIAKFFNEGNFDKAYPLAVKAHEIAGANCVEEKDKRLMLALNVAEIQTKREKKDEAREIFEKNLDLAEEVYGADNVDFNNYLDSLIKLSINNKSYEKFEKYALKSVEVKRSVFGIDNFETVRELRRMAIFYRRLKEYEKAEPFYLEAISISDRLTMNEKIQKLSVVNEYRSYLLERFGEKEGGRKDEEFMKNRSQVYVTSDNRLVLNGRALKLFKPEYPTNAFVAKVTGEVRVEITIGEDGKVIKAKAISGHPYLRPSSEQAAKASTFLPSYVDGKPIQVTGIIVYIF